MITFSNIADPIQEFSFSVPQTSVLILRICLKSNFIAPVVIQPVLQNWIKNDGTILEADYKVLPSYIYLSPHAPANITLTINLPEALNHGDELYTSVRFSGIKDCTAALKIKIDQSAPTVHFYEQNVDAAIPYPANSTGKSGTQHDEQSFIKSEQAAKILVGMSGLDLIPSRWLVAELAIHLCHIGYRKAALQQQKEFAANFRRTKLFKNGVLMLAASQFIHWVSVSLTISSGIQSVTGNKPKYNGMLNNWEGWLLNLAGVDIEESGLQSVNVLFSDHPDFETILKEIGVDPEQWFLYLVLGLMEVSPKIKTLLEQICSHLPDEKVIAVKKKKIPKKILNEKGSLQR